MPDLKCTSEMLDDVAKCVAAALDGSQPIEDQRYATGIAKAALLDNAPALIHAARVALAENDPTLIDAAWLCKIASPSARGYDIACVGLGINVSLDGLKRWQVEIRQDGANISFGEFKTRDQLRHLLSGLRVELKEIGNA